MCAQCKANIEHLTKQQKQQSYWILKSYSPTTDDYPIKWMAKDRVDNNSSGMLRWQPFDTFNFTLDLDLDWDWDTDNNGVIRAYHFECSMFNVQCSLIVLLLNVFQMNFLVFNVRSAIIITALSIYVYFNHSMDFGCRGVQNNNRVIGASFKKYYRLVGWRFLKRNTCAKRIKCFNVKMFRFFFLFIYYFRQWRQRQGYIQTPRCINVCTI